MAREGQSPWSDWREIPLAGCPWLSGLGFSTPPAAALAADAWPGTQLDPQQAGTTPKVTISALSGLYSAGNVAGYFFQTPLPDYVVNKQPTNLAAWGGLSDEPMDEDGVLRAILIENVLTAVSAQGISAVTISGFNAAVKFRGFGGPVDGVDTQDEAVASSNVIAPAAVPLVSVFGNMSLPSVAPDDFNDAITFAEVDGAFGFARLRTLVLIPNTVAIGDYIEMTFQFPVPAGLGGDVIQWYGAKFCYVQQPFSLPVNSTIQQLGQDVDAFWSQLEAESRLDDLPYQP